MPSVFDEEAATEGAQTPLRSLPNSSAVTSPPEVILSWDNLTYEVKSKKDSWRTILHGISGEAHAGEVIAIIGSSGAGKTTLLNALSGRIIGGKLSGSILYRGAKRHPGHFKRISAYVQQDDLMHPLLTVQETLSYASRLRLPNKYYDRKQKAERVDTVIRQLRLEAARNTRIGDAKVRGVSGGERKRVSIGTELLTDPRLLFLDEPTSGLDSNSSELVVELVKSISQKQGIATLMTIHQPNARIFNTFDKVILLSQGRVVYFGPTSTAIEYFTNIGFECPVHENPADYFVDLMTLDYRSEETLARSKEQVQTLADKFAEYDTEKSNVSSSSSREKGLAAQGEELSPDDFDLPRNNWFYEYSTLAHRDWSNILRNVPFLAGQIVQSVFMALLIGFMFFYLKHDAPSIQNRLGVLFIVVVNSSFPIVMPLLTLFFSERDIMVRERSSATFRVTSFFVSKATTYLPIAFICNIFFFIGVYFISHLTFDAGKFFIGLATFFCNSTVSIMFLLLVGAAVKTMDVGFIIAPAVLTIQLLFGGLFANPATITPVLSWIRWINPIQYGFSSLVQNEFNGLEFSCNPGEQCYQNGQQVIDAYGVGRFTIWQNILLLLMLGAVDAIVGYVFLRWVAKPKTIWL
ncbi:hypothetical protein EV183_004359 [Coemansia sp. RSA 2336]|nr:hypothetical protein EV183_004359 [Coemansia sp. RSA 2336]